MAWTTEPREINHETDPVWRFVRRCFVCALEEEA